MKNQNNYTTTINNTYQKAISKLLIVFVFIMGSIQMKAATITSTATGGTWATGSTWVGGVAPATGDAVIIATTGTNSVSIGANLTQTAAGSVTINNGAILNMTTTGVTASLGALTINTGGKFNCSRALTVQGATNISGTVTFASTSGTSRAIAFTGNVTLNAGAVWTEPATGNGANNTYAFAGNFTNNATTFNALGTGNHTFSGTAKTISGATATTFKALVINGTVTNNLAAHLTVSTGLTGTGTLTQGTNSYLNLVAIATITTLTATAAGDTVNYSGVAQTAKVTTYNNLTLSGSLAKTFATTPTVNGVLSMEGTATITVTTGGVTYGGSATLKYNTATARTATTEEWITPFAATGGIVIANTGAITMPGASVLNANVPLTINVGATLTPGANLLTVGGNFTINGTFTSGSGGVTIANNATAQAISGFTTTGPLSMTKTAGTATISGNINGAALTINGSGGTINMGTGTHTFTGNVTLTAGTMNGGSSTINVNSTSATAWTGTGSVFSAGTSTVVFGGVAQTINTTTTFNNLTFAASGAKTIATGTTTTVNGILSMQGTATATVTGTLTYGASSTLEYKGTALQTTGAEFPATFSGTGGVIINNASGVTLNSARSLNTASKLTLTVGLFTTTATNLLTVLNTATTAIAGGSTTTFINGPVKWSLANTAGTYVFPVGSTGTNYFPFTLATTAASSPIITVQAFNSDPGAAATYQSPIIGLSHNEYWLGTLNSGTFTGSVSITRQVGLGNYSVIGKSTLQTGQYTSIHGTVSAASLLNSDAISSLGYFNMSATSACPTYALTGTTSSGICSGTPATVSVTGNAVNLPIGLYVVTYNLGSPNTATGLTSSMNVVAAGSGSFTTSNLAATGTTLLTITQITSGPCNNAISASNTVSIVTAVSSTPTLLLAISSGANPQCAGSSITYTATPSSLGGGSVSNYNFKVNGSTVQSGATATYTSSAMTNGDLVTCDITVSGGACLTSTTATSNTITMTVNPNFTPAVSLDLTTGTNPGCIGSTVVFTGTPSNYGAGTVSNYQFLVNGVSKQSGATTTYTTSTLADNYLVRVNITITGGTCVTATTAFDTTTMNISPLPAGRLTANGPFCLTGSGLLNYVDTLAVEPYDIIYSDGTANRTSLGNMSGIDFATFTSPVTSTTIYTIVSVTDALGCVGTTGFGKNKDTITVNANNTVTRTSAAGTVAQTVCLNSAITNITYSTTGATGATFAGLPTGVNGSWASNAITISGSPSVAGAATYTVTLTGGCGTITTTGSITTTANNTVTLTSAVGTDAQTKCISTAITNITYSTVGATGATFAGLPTGVTGSWLSNVVTISGTPSVAGAATYTVTTTGGCGSTTATGTITVTANNTATLSSAVGTNAQTVCISTPITNITYSTVGATGATFAGLPTGVSGSWLSNVVTISGTPSVAGVATYTVTTTGGCGSTTATGTITTTANNTVTLTSAVGTNAQTKCISTAVTNITYSTVGATGATFAGLPTGVSGSWLSNVVTISGTPSVAGAATYTVTTTGGCGSTTATGTITVNALPTVSSTVAPSATVCSGTSVILSGTGASSYTWTGGITNATAFSATSTTTYTVTGTDANGCQNTSTRLITVNALPTVSSTVAPSATVCNGTSVTLSGTGATSYAWTGGITNATAFSATSTTTYTVTGTDVNGCQNTSTRLITVNSLPTVSSTVSPSATVCSGTSVTLSGTGASSYAWTGGITNATAFSATATTTYTVTGTDANGCQNTATRLITVNALPTVSSTVAPSATVCSGTLVTLSGTGASSYAWTGSVTNATAFSANTTTTYTVTGTDANGCQNTSTTTISVTAPPSNSVAGSSASICSSGVVLAANTPTVGIGTWTVVSGPSMNVSQFSNIHNPASTFIPDGGTGNYTLSWTITNSPCTASSSSITLSVVSPGTWFGVNNDWFDANNWCGGIPTSTTNVVITSSVSNMPLISTIGAVCNSITINGAASLNMSSTSDLTVFGNWTNSGTFTSGGGSVSFTGSAAQTIVGTTTFDNMFVNNTSGVTLNNNIVINSILELDNGNVRTGANYVQIEANAYPIAIGGFIDGNLKQYIPSGFGISAYYPIGSNSNASALDIFFNNVSTDGYVTASSSTGDHAQAASSGFNLSQTVNRTWTLTNGGISYDEFQVGMSYQSSDFDAGYSDSYGDLRVYTAGSWIDLPNSVQTPNYISASSVTDFGDYQIGDVNPVPSAYSISPSVGAQNQTLNITISGAGFISGATSVNASSGISVSNVVVSSTNSLTATIAISSTASIGQHSFSVTNIAPGGGTSSNLSFTVIGGLPVPNFIASNTTISCFANGSTTFNNLSSNATSYHWNFGSGANPATATGVGPYTVTYTSSGTKTVKLVATNGNGSDSLTLSNYITVNASVPALPTNINGLVGLCSSLNSNVVYSCPSASNATGYIWTLPSGLTYVSGQGTTAITVVPAIGFTIGSISVTDTNACGTNPGALNLNLSATPPLLTGSISGPAVVCGISTANYSVSALPGTSTFNWTVPSGVIITSGQGTPSILTNVAAGTIVGNITVQAISNCGSSATLSLTITKKPLAPSTIVGPSSLCGATSATLTTSSLGATSFSWTLPAGVTAISGTGTSSINVGIASTFVAGNVNVSAVNACGTTTGTALPIYVKVPAASTSIAGLTNLCGITSTSYTATGVPGATSYTWILPSGLSQLSASANNVTVQNTSYSSGNIMVQASNTCGVGPAKTLIMNQAPPAPGLISGPTVTCGVTTASYSVAAVTGAISYSWAVPSGASIIAGLGTNSIVATWSTPVAGNVSVMASNSCANSVARTLAINKVPANPVAISGPTVLCTLGGTATFSIPVVTGATSYLWVVPSSLTVLAGQGTNSLLVMVPTTLAAGTIRVYAQTSCGNSGYQSISYGACAAPIEMSNDVINAISLYPNPASSNFTLDMLMEKDQMVVKEVYDVLGNMVINEKHKLSTGSNSVNTNIELLSNGFYFVKILDTDGNTLFTQRLIKN